jgi:branched-subunit amino acid ABC-type transport system permease component
MDVLPQLIANSIIAGSLYALVAMSFNLIYGASRVLNLAHGALGTVAAYTVYLSFATLSFPLPASIFLGIVSGAVLAWSMEAGIFRHLRKNKASDLVLLISSLGALVVIESLIAIFFTSQFKSMATILGEVRRVELFGAVLTDVQLVTIGSALAVFLAFWLMLSFTRFGKALRAVSDDEEVARIVGIDTQKIIGYVFCIGGAVMAGAGILSGLDTGIEPRMGFLLILLGAIASIIGGIGNVYGAFLGAYLLGFVENFGVWFTAVQMKYIIIFSVLIFFLLFLPRGFFGKK